MVLLLNNIARSAQERLIFSGLDGLGMVLGDTGGRSHYFYQLSLCQNEDWDLVMLYE
jgi:hypothetical protein